MSSISVSRIVAACRPIRPASDSFTPGRASALPSGMRAPASAATTVSVKCSRCRSRSTAGNADAVAPETKDASSSITVTVRLPKAMRLGYPYRIHSRNALASAHGLPTQRNARPGGGEALSKAPMRPAAISRSRICRSACSVRPPECRGGSASLSATRILDVPAAASSLDGLATEAAQFCAAPSLDPLMSRGIEAWSALRLALSRALSTEHADDKNLRQYLAPMARMELRMPAIIRNFTDLPRFFTPAMPGACFARTIH